MKKILLILFAAVTLASCASKDDKIVGIWEVKNEFNEATYEILEYQGKFFGKVRYYKDQNSEYEGDNRKEDYFLTDLEAKDSTSYDKGVLHLPDGSMNVISFDLIDANTLEARMVFEGEPYTEVWIRQGSKAAKTVSSPKGVLSRKDQEKVNNEKSILLPEKLSRNIDEKSIVNTTLQEQSNQSSPASEADKIVGVWDVQTDYYAAIYEIEEREGKFIGKVHYYNDGTTEYTGKNTGDDYFLSDVVKKENSYEDGKMYLPDGSHYRVIFQLKHENKLLAKMTVDGKPYVETWTRNKDHK